MKYILEIKPEYEANGIMILGARDSHLYVTTLAVENLEELNSDYINEHFGDLQDEAYHRGLAEGKKAFDLLDAERDAEYQRGLDDAWEAAKKLFSTMADSDIEKVFPTEWNNGGFNALINLQPREAIEKLKAYEEKEKQKAEDEIKVGDEVKPFYTDITGVVTLIDGDTIYVLWRDGSSTSTLKLKEVVKTDRHFDIDKILKEMQS